MRELTETEIDAVSGGFFNATGAGSRAILAFVSQRNSATQIGVNLGAANSFNVNAASQSNSSSIGGGGVTPPTPPTPPPHVVI